MIPHRTTALGMSVALLAVKILTMIIVSLVAGMVAVVAPCGHRATSIRNADVVVNYRFHWSYKWRQKL